jgi:membrane protein required for colicin V production
MLVFDIIIAIIILFFAYKGYKNGLIKELGSLVALIAGIFLAIRFSDFMDSIIRNNTSIDSEYVPILSFAVIFIAVVVCVIMFSKILDKFLKVIKLDWLNKLGGVFFSTAKTVLILGGLFFLVIQLNDNLEVLPDSFAQKSIMFKVLVDAFEFTFPYLDHFTSINL